MTFLIAIAVVGVILFSISLVITTISVMEKYYAYRIIAEQDEIIREYEELILKLEEGKEK
jgi:hypothetical protein